MAKHHNIEIDAMHTLENFCDAYDNEESIVVLEAIANALDAEADRVEITLKDMSITFRDNGPGMDRKQFKMYHKISGSAKTKGRGIGFAGVGAKVYLAIWKNTVIHTETYGNDGPLASDMQVIYRKLKWKDSDTSLSLRMRGTSYSVKLREKDYKVLQSKLQDIILDVFNPAMLNGLAITINGNKLKPWDPPRVFRTHGVVKSKNLAFPTTLSLMREDVPAKYRHVQYEVWGKNVTTKKPDWIADVSEPYKNRVYAIVDAKKCSKHLKINKNSFKSGQGTVADMYKNVERWLHEMLRKEGYIEKQSGEVQHSAKLSKFFQKLFKNPEYDWLNPNTTSGSGSGTGSGTGSMKTSHKEQSEKKDDGKHKENKNENKGGSGISITLVDRGEVSWDGRLDPETNNFICNRKHPLYRKYERNEDARNQRVKSILFSELIKNGAKRHKITTDEAFNTHRVLMTEAKDLKVV